MGFDDIILGSNIFEKYYEDVYKNTLKGLTSSDIYLRRFTEMVLRNEFGRGSFEEFLKEIDSKKTVLNIMIMDIQGYF